MAAGPEGDVHPVLPEEKKRTHDVVAGLDLMIDVLDPGTIGCEQRDRMVHLIDAQERRLTDAVADPRVADPGPEGFVASRIGGAEAYVTEAGNAGIARAMITGAADRGPPG